MLEIKNIKIKTHPHSYLNFIVKLFDYLGGLFNYHILNL